jgi:hypothetical protein
MNQKLMAHISHQKEQENMDYIILVNRLAVRHIKCKPKEQFMNEKFWLGLHNKYLKGRTISRVQYANKQDQQALGWDGQRVIQIVFTDGHSIFPSADEEGNYPGTIISTESEEKGHGMLV